MSLEIKPFKPILINLNFRKKHENLQFINIVIRLISKCQRNRIYSNTLWIVQTSC